MFRILLTIFIRMGLFVGAGARLTYQNRTEKSLKTLCCMYTFKSVLNTQAHTCERDRKKNDNNVWIDIHCFISYLTMKSGSHR